MDGGTVSLFSVAEGDDVAAILSDVSPIFARIAALPLDRRVQAVNEIRASLLPYSPFKEEPVDYVKWVPMLAVEANDYNPNSVAPPEMELLRLSIMADGYTQPIVTNREDGTHVVVDGFHRNRVGRECEDVKARINGYLPVVQIKASQTDKSDRMASTIRHNRARGKHRVEAMSEIVLELKRRNWSDERIGKNLGMDADEILRLCQISGLTEMFADQDFSRAWDAEGPVAPEDFEELTDNVAEYADEVEDLRTVNTSDANRVFHTFDKWECHKAGFYKLTPPEGMKKPEAQKAYAAFLRDDARFRAGLERVIAEWKHSCEHYLTNVAMNRIAWLGQAAACIETGIPSEFRGGYGLLTPIEQVAADNLALEYLNRWMVANGRPEVTLQEAYSGDRQSDIY